MKKQWVKRSITWIVTLALMLQIIPLTVLAESGTETGALVPGVAQSIAKDVDPGAYIVEEDVSKREENVKHFRMSDGAYTAVVYDEPVHYLDNGEWKEIDNTLIRREEEGETNSYYTNKTNGFAVNLPETIGASAPVIVQRGAAQLSFALQVDGSTRAEFTQPQDAKVLAQQLAEKLETADSENEKIKIANAAKTELPNLRSGVTYASLIQGVDLDYQIHGASLKESIILQNVPTQESYVFDFTYCGLTATLNEDRSLTFYEPGETEPVFVITAPYMEDKTGTVCNDVEVTIEKTDTGCLYIVTPSREWLTDAGREYPVVIDPTIETNSYAVTSNATSSSMGSSYVSYFNSTFAKQYLFAGTFISGVSLSPLLYFPNVGLGGGNPQIANAKLSMQYNASLSDCDNDLQINAQMVTGNWTMDGNFIYGSAMPAVSGSILDYAILSDVRVADADTDIVAFDVTAAARKWYSDATTNKGLVLKPAGTAGTSANYVCFCSNTYSGSGVKKPTLELTYRDMAGLESYGSYTSMEAGRGGAVHVDNFYNNLVVEQPVAAVSGERMPVSIGIVYNESQTAAAVDTSFGVGWRCNYSMRINAYGLQGYGYYLTDEDGTDHFFVTAGGNGSSGYQDEDDLGYTLYTSFTGSSAQKYYKMTADDTTLFFNSSGWLTFIEDNNGNVITVSRNSSNQITQITDGAGRHYTFSYSNGKVSYITAPDSRTAVFGYSNGYLQSIIFPDGQSVSYIMTDGKLSRVNNSDGTRVDIALGTSSGFATRTLSHKNSSGTLIDSLTLTFKKFATDITDRYGDTVSKQFDRRGNLTGELNMQSNMASGYTYGLSSGSGRLLTSSSSTRVPAANLIDDGSFETNLSAYTYTQYSGAAAGLTTNANGVFTGNKAVSVTRTSGSTPVTVRRDVSNLISLQNGNYYTASVYIKTNGTLAGSGVRLAFIFTDSMQGSYVTAGDYYNDTHGEWQRISVTASITSSTTALTLSMELAGDSLGVAFFDDLQLEPGQVANDFNPIQNSTFALDNYGWQPSDTDFNVYYLNYNDLKYVYFPASVSSERYLYQDIKLPGNEGDVFSFGGWGKSTAAASFDVDEDGNKSKPFAYGVPTFRIELAFLDGNGIIEDGIYTADFDSATASWQCASATVSAPAAYTAIRIYLRMDYNIGDPNFANVFLCGGGLATNYRYDGEGRLTEVVAPNGTVTAVEYDGEDNIKSVASSDSDSRVLFSYTDGGDLSNVYLTDGQYAETERDSYGNVTRTATKVSQAVTTPSVNTAYYLRSAATGDLLYTDGVDMSVASWEDRDTNRTAFQFLANGSQFKLYNAWRIGSVGISGGGAVVMASGTLFSFDILQNPDRSLTFQNSGGLCLAVSNGDVIAEQAADTPTAAQRWYVLAVEDNTAKYMQTESTYSTNGNYLATSKDEQGKITAYQYHADSGRLEYVIAPSGNRVDYSYNTNNDQLTALTQSGSTVNFTYSGDRLTDISTPTATYHYAVDSLLRPSAISITGRTYPLESYTYDDPAANNPDGRGNLKQILYANSQTVNFEYDAFDRLTRKYYNNSPFSYRYTYDLNGNLVRVADGVNGVTTGYLFDSQGRSAGFESVRTGNIPLISELYRYNNDSTLASTDLYIDGVKQYTRGITYGSAANGQLDGAVYGVTLNGNDSLTYAYDGFGRVTNKYLATNTGYPSRTTYTYKQGGYGTNSTGNQVGAIFTSMAGYYTYQADYSYDNDGRITTISAYSGYNSSDNDYVTYSYDGQGRLVRVEDMYGYTVTLYTYDAAGNITAKTVYPYSYAYDPTTTPTSTVTYTYGDSAWGDLLTSYNGNGITYDASGNPTTYYNGAQFTWTGRNLDTAQVGSTTYTYRYNADGIRTQKRMGNTVATQYYLSDNTVVAEKTGNDLLVYLLDENGEYYGFIYNGTTYYYCKNLQGDVKYIYDLNGNIKAWYRYDTWGACTVHNVGSSTLGDINPIRYRGYYYDTETGLYYLQSRYYDPNTGRFISPDALEYLGANGTVDSYNLYAYCENDPVNGVDSSGHVKIDKKQIKNIVEFIIGSAKAFFQANKMMVPSFTSFLASKWSLLSLKLGAIPVYGWVVATVVAAIGITIAGVIAYAYLNNKGIEFGFKTKWVWFVPVPVPYFNYI